jgi:hypothetical protein
MALLKLNQIKDVIITKKLIQDDATNIVAAVRDGAVDPLDALLFIKYLTDMGEIVRKQIMGDAIDEFAKYDQREATRRGVKMSQKETGVRYDYTKTSLWEQANNEVKQATEKRKRIETMCKAASKKMTILDEETGETIEINPPIKKSTTTIVMSVKEDFSHIEILD